MGWEELLVEMFYSRLVGPSRHGTDKVISRRSGRLVEPSRLYSRPIMLGPI